MSSIGNILAPASTVAAGTNQNSASPKASAASQQAVTSSAAQAGGTAASVSIGASSKTRGTSTGDARQVDAAFEKQQAKDNVKKKEDEGKTLKKSVDVTA